MNKQELIKQAEKLQTELDILKKKIEKCNDESVRWRAEQNSIYYYVPDSGMTTSMNDVTCKQEIDSWVDRYRYATGNYFKTEQEAIDYKENMLAKQKLKDLALRLNNGVEIDWDKTHEYKYYIYYELRENGFELMQEETKHWYDLGNVYCLDKNFLDIAKQEIGKEELIKLIQSGV